MTLDLDALEQKARAATPGRWKACVSQMGLHHVRVEDDNGPTKAIVCETGWVPCTIENPPEARALFIAAASPDVVLALVARLRAAEEARDDLAAVCGAVCVLASLAPGEALVKVAGQMLHERAPVIAVDRLRARADASESRATRAEAKLAEMFSYAEVARNNVEVNEELIAKEQRAERAEAQRDRLAGALRTIADTCVIVSGQPGNTWMDLAIKRREVARAALAEVDREGKT